MTVKNSALEAVENSKSKLTELSDALWDYPETKYKEYYAANLLADFLKKEGFSVEKPIAEIETAFCASYGAGAPVIGLLAEYDALEGMSQQAECDCCIPVQQGAPGHGCGHNLLGVGVIGAALAIKAYLQKTICSGTVKVFGCPAEEGGSGKTFMAREGVFDSLDAAFSWHPGDTNNVSNGSNLANCQVIYRYKGKAAHAAICPEMGRSALDAVEMMNMGVQFLREHIPQECRVQLSL